ncbi:hypothetical protein J6590_044273 [Homalodisca vitripennis]|nr:hypothetical protein J6590_044273 [Homalodisca vitripennis]
MLVGLLAYLLSERSGAELGSSECVIIMDQPSTSSTNRSELVCRSVLSGMLRGCVLTETRLFSFCTFCGTPGPSIKGCTILPAGVTGIWPDQASDVTAPPSHHSACRGGTALRSKKWLSP